MRIELAKLRNNSADVQCDFDKVQLGFIDACNTHVHDANEHLVLQKIRLDQ